MSLAELLPITSEQVRVLGCLMEKHLTTPNNYPITPNSLMLACNQKSNRHPVMQLSEGKVAQLVNQLTELHLTRLDYGERVNKVSHLAPGTLSLNLEEQAVLAMLMLREPLTLNDIKARTQKMAEFDNADEVKIVVDELMERELPLVFHIPKGPGQREDRYTHLLAGEPDPETYTKTASLLTNNVSKDEEIEQLKSRITRLEEHLGLSAVNEDE